MIDVPAHAAARGGWVDRSHPQRLALTAWSLMLTRLALTAWSLTLTPLEAAPPTLTQVFPPGGQRGTTVAATFTGKLDGAVKVEAPGLEVAAGEKAGQFAITIPADFGGDRAWIRVYNDEGASAVIPFLVSTLPERLEKEPNNSPKEAEVLDTPRAVVNGVLKNADTDAFLVPLTAGDTLVAALDAHTRLGSPIDAVLQIALPDGTVLADNHDDLGLDPRLAFTAPADGKYLVRLFGFLAEPNTNISLQGNDNCLYRLTLTTGAFVTHARPVSIHSDPSKTIRLYGWNLPTADLGVLPVPLPLEREPRTDLRLPAGTDWASIGGPELAGSARVRRVPFATSVRAADGGPNPALSLPHAVTGCLQSPGQIDSYSLALQKGQVLLVTAEARTWGSPVDPVVRLADPEGKKVAEVDDTAGGRDALLTYTAPRDGTFLVSLTDRHRAGSDRHFYQLTCRLDEPDFELTAAADTVTLPADKPAEIAVTVVRRGNIGPITVTAEGLPPGVTVEPGVSEPKGDSAKKVIVRLKGAGTAHSGRIRLVGRTSEPALERPVLTPPQLGVAFDTLWLTALPKPAAGG